MAKIYSENILNSCATNEGRWVDSGKFHVPFSILVYGFAAGDAIQVYVSNQPGQPTLCAPMCGDGTMPYATMDINAISSDDVIPINYPVRWIRCRKSASSGSQTTRADLCAVKYA